MLLHRQQLKNLALHGYIEFEAKTANLPQERSFVFGLSSVVLLVSQETCQPDSAEEQTSEVVSLCAIGVQLKRSVSKLGFQKTKLSHKRIQPCIRDLYIGSNGNLKANDVVMHL